MSVIHPSHTLPYYNRTNMYSFPLPVEDRWVGLPPSIIMGVLRRNLQLARGSAESVCVCTHRYLYHAPPRLHTQPRTLTTPLHATTLHSNLLPAHTPAPHSHLSFGYKLTVTTRPTGLAPNVAKDRAPPHPSRLGKVYKEP